MSEKKEKAKRKVKRVSAKELAQANERVRFCETTLAQTRARAQQVVQEAASKLQAARNELDELCRRVRQEEMEEAAK